MYKFMRRLLAMTLALAVCMSVVVFPALADSSEPPVSVTITVKEADGSKTTTTTTTTTTTSTAGGTTTTQDTENWESQNVKTDSQKSEAGSTTTTVDTNITTDKKGSETTTVSQNSDSVSGSTTGEEVTDVTNTTTTTTITKDALISSETDPEETTAPTEKWETTSTTEGNWTPGELKTGTAGSSKVNSSQSGTISYDRDTDVTLNMSSTQTTDSQEVTVTAVAASDVAGGKIVLPTAGTTTEEIKDGSGYVIGYKITTISVEAVADGYRVTTVVAETGTNPQIDPTNTLPVVPVPDSETAASEAPQGYTSGQPDTTVTVGDKTINTKEVITEIKDSDGKVIGYTITTTKTTTEPSDKEVPSTAASAVTYILPEKPEESVTTDAAGNTTTVTVEEIVEDGEVVGYQRNVIITDASGTELYTEQEMLYRTEKTDSTQVVKDTNKLVTTETTVKTVMGTALRDGTQTSTKKYTWQTTVNTTEDVYNQVKADGEVYVVYKGTLFRVEPGTGHGTVTMTSVQPNYAGLMPATGVVDRDKDLYHRYNEDELKNANSFGTYDFQWLGEYGLESAIRVQTNKANTYQAHQFVLKDEDGNNHYVYCADLMTSPQEGFRYNMENVFDASYYGSDAAKQIQAIAVNGYWGTASGTGSLTAVKDMLKAAWDNDNDLKAVFPNKRDIDALTDGEALTATQAAIWVYGNSNSTSAHVTENDPVGCYYLGNEVFTTMDSASEARTKALFDYLCKTPAPSSDTTTPLITKKDFATEASITVKDKLANDKYKTDVSFNLAIDKSKLTGNLSVKVMDSSGKVLAEKYLATNDTNLVGKLFTSESITSDGKYVFRDLEIAPGTMINLALSGTQDLGFGAYLYTAEVKSTSPSHSQTFVGLSEGTRQVNLNVDLKFEVEDPTHTTTAYDPATRLDTRTDSKVDTLHQMKVKTETTSQTQRDWYGTVTTTNTLTQTTHSHRNWSSSFFRYLPTDEPGGGTPEDGDRLRGGWGSFALADNFISEMIIPDEGVPLAGVPKTGDLSILWIALSAVSVAGYLLLSRKKETQV